MGYKKGKKMKIMHPGLAIKITQEATRTQEKVELQQNNITLDAKSILGVMTLCTIENIKIITKDKKTRENITKLLESEE